MDDSSKVNEWHPLWKTGTLIEGGKTKSSQCVKLHAVCPSVWVLLTRGWWPIGWSYDQVEGQ